MHRGYLGIKPSPRELPFRGAFRVRNSSEWKVRLRGVDHHGQVQGVSPEHRRCDPGLGDLILDYVTPFLRARARRVRTLRTPAPQDRGGAPGDG